jgi:hypothetical protein
MTKTTCLAVVTVLSLAAPALAQAPQPGAPPAAEAAPPMPKPAKELEDFMKPFEGNWKCETKWPAGAMGPGSPEMTAKSTVKFKKDLEGYFYRGDYEIKKQKGVPMAMKGVFYIGYDPGGSQITISAMDTMGGHAFGTGKIEGDKISYNSDGYMMGKKVKIREVMGKTGPKEGFHKMEVDMGKGFMPMGEDNCKR